MATAAQEDRSLAALISAYECIPQEEFNSPDKIKYETPQHEGAVTRFLECLESGERFEFKWHEESEGTSTKKCKCFKTITDTLMDMTRAVPPDVPVKPISDYKNNLARIVALCKNTKLSLDMMHNIIANDAFPLAPVSKLLDEIIQKLNVLIENQYRLTSDLIDYIHSIPQLASQKYEDILKFKISTPILVFEFSLVQMLLRLIEAVDAGNKNSVDICIQDMLQLFSDASFILNSSLEDLQGQLKNARLQAEARDRVLLKSIIDNIATYMDYLVGLLKLE